MISSHSCGEVVSSAPRAVVAALLTRMSIRPKRWSAAPITSRWASGRERSAGTKIASAPWRSARSAATAAPRRRLRPVIRIASAPRRAISRAVASPMPEVPPVTTAVFPSKGAMVAGGGGYRPTRWFLRSASDWPRATLTSCRSLTSGTATSHQAPPSPHR